MSPRSRDSPACWHFEPISSLPEPERVALPTWQNAPRRIPFAPCCGEIDRSGDDFRVSLFRAEIFMAHEHTHVANATASAPAEARVDASCGGGALRPKKSAPGVGFRFDALEHRASDKFFVHRSARTRVILGEERPSALRKTVMDAGRPVMRAVLGRPAARDL
jgi:hypothetical protein